MAKKCIICGEEAILVIKGTNDVYCKNCAEENFDDISYLEKIEEPKPADTIIDDEVSDEESEPKE
ncbi:hypothetical protein J4464_07155 [Candidatus Woesearchaeota archaeon]|nr:hypothetical protein [Candidatus Woesearchaeota archaeon]